MKKFFAVLTMVALVAPFSIGCGDKKTTGTKVEKTVTTPESEKTITREKEKTVNTDNDGGSTVTETDTKKVDIDR